jgi:hypothetical protein
MLMKIGDLYKKYDIMPQLVTHQLRVGAVGKIIAESWVDSCDVIFCTQLCLIHDMGNIVKFDLENPNPSKFGKIENIDVWRGVQKQYREKYGDSAHAATENILKEANLTQYIQYINEEERLYFAEPNEGQLGQSLLPSIILMYSDCRVTPSGVVSYRERIDDLKARYGGGKTPTWYDWTYTFEKWLQSHVKIDLNSIDNAMVEPLFDELMTSTI